MTHYQMHDREDHGTGFTPNEQSITDLEDERDRLEAEVNRWHAEAVHEQMKSTRLIMKVEAYRAALRQIVWLADATEPLSVRTADIARKALED